MRRFALVRLGKSVHVDETRVWWFPLGFLMEKAGCRDDLGGLPLGFLIGNVQRRGPFHEATPGYGRQS